MNPCLIYPKFLFILCLDSKLREKRKEGKGKERKGRGREGKNYIVFIGRKGRIKNEILFSF